MSMSLKCFENQDEGERRPEEKDALFMILLLRRDFILLLPDTGICHPPLTKIQRTFDTMENLKRSFSGLVSWL